MRVEVAAFHFWNDIIWLGYSYAGGGKEESAYTEGWSSDLEGAERYAELEQVLEARFGFDSKLPFLVDSRHTDRIVGVGSPFIGCSQVFLDKTMPADLKAIMMAWFLKHGVSCLEVEAAWQTAEEINRRWSAAMGDYLNNSDPEDIGQNRALSVLEAGIRSITPEEPVRSVAASVRRG